MRPVSTYFVDFRSLCRIEPNTRKRPVFLLMFAVLAKDGRVTHRAAAPIFTYGAPDYAELQLVPPAVQ